MEVQQSARYRSSNQTGQRIRSYEHCYRARPACRRKPSLEVKDNSREEPGFCGSKEKTHRVKAVRRADKNHATGHQTPYHHNHSNPAARTYTRQCQVAGDLQSQITNKKYAEAGSKYVIAETELRSHLQGCKT